MGVCQQCFKCSARKFYDCLKSCLVVYYTVGYGCVFCGDKWCGGTKKEVKWFLCEREEGQQEYIV